MIPKKPRESNLEKIRALPQVDEVYKEGGGLWFCEFKDGWRWGGDHTSPIHYVAEETLVKLLREAKGAMTCTCEECLEILARLK